MGAVELLVGAVFAVDVGEIGEGVDEPGEADAVLDPDAHFGLLLAAAVGGGDHFDDEVGAEGERFFVVGRELGEAFGREPGDVGHSAAEVSGADFGVCADGFAAGGVGPVAYLPADACGAAAAVPTGESHDEERSPVRRLQSGGRG